MLEFLEYELKVAVILAAFYIFYRLLLSRETLHRLNRIVLICTAALSFVLPLCVITIHRTVEQTGQALQVVSSGMVVSEASSGPQWWLVALSVIYFAGVAAVLVRIVVGVVAVMRTIRKGERRTAADGTEVIVTSGNVPPFSWMKWIVMSEEDFRSGNEHIIKHEKAHIKFGHSKDVLLVDVITALQWFNPAVWMLKSDLRAVHEYEADDAVLRQGADIKEYQYSLIRKAVSASGYSITNSFNHSILKNRITMMSKNRSTMLRGLRVLYVVPLVAVALTANAKTVVSYKVSENLQHAADTVKTVVLNGDVSVSSGDVTVTGLPDNYRIIVNGKEMTQEELKDFPVDIVKSISVIKDDALGVNGKLVIVAADSAGTTKSDVKIDTEGDIIKITVENTSKLEKGETPQPLVIVDGKEASSDILQTIDTDDISHITVYKNKKDIKKYGKKGKNGVIVIDLKDKK